MTQPRASVNGQTPKLVAAWALLLVASSLLQPAALAQDQNVEDPEQTESLSVIQGEPEEPQSSKVEPPNSSPDPTPLPKPPLGFKFGADVAPSDRDQIKAAASWTQDYWGKRAGSMTVYAYGDLGLLLDAFGQDCGCPGWTSLWNNLNYELRTESISTAPGALLAHTGQPPWRKPGGLTNIAHSHFHTIQRTLTGGNTDPVWMAEGGADFSQAKVLSANGRTNFTSGRAQTFAELRRETIKEQDPWRYLRLSDLESWPQIEAIRAPKRAPYAIGFLAIEYIGARYGEQAILEYWQKWGEILQAGNGTWKDALQAVLGIPVDRFYSDFEAYRARL